MKPYAALAVMACCVYVSAPQMEAFSETARDFLAQGEQALASGNIDRAVEDFSQAIRLRLDDAQSWFGRGRALVAAGRFRDAIDDFDQAIRLRPGFADAQLERGFAYGQAGDFTRAIEDLNRVLALEPSNLRAVTLRGDAQARLGKYAEAISDFSDALKIAALRSGTDTATLVRLHLNRSHVYTLLGQHEAALADRNQAVLLAPKDPEAYLARGGTLHELGRHEQGIADRNEAIRLKPDFAEAWFARGSSYFLLGDYRKASLDMNQALHLKPNSEDVKDLYNRALIEFAKETLGLRASTGMPHTKGTIPEVLSSHPVESKPDTRLASQMQATPAPAMNTVATAVIITPKIKTDSNVKEDQTFEEHKNPTGTQQASVISSPPANPRGSTLPANGSGSTPTTALPTAVKSAISTSGVTASAALHNQRGRDLIQQRKYREALDEFTAALKDRPDFTLALNGRGFAHMLLLEWSQAKEDIDAAIKIDPNYANAYHNRAVVNKALGDLAGAKADDLKYWQLSHPK